MRSEGSTRMNTSTGTQIGDDDDGQVFCISQSTVVALHDDDHDDDDDDTDDDDTDDNYDDDDDGYGDDDDDDYDDTNDGAVCVDTRVTALVEVLFVMKWTWSMRLVWRASQL